MITLAEHHDNVLTGRVCHMDCTRDELTHILPMLVGIKPESVDTGVVTPTVFAYNARVNGDEVSVIELFKQEVAPGVWALPGKKTVNLDPRDYKD